uniref:Uncharacterized protein n=1 Tax=Cacopsylla melanoneura TaxID=428564 RepID=A0A8D8ZFK2_9HEMI
MIIYFICGFSTCKDFAATSLLCQYLKKCYPNQFHYRKIVTHKDCYKGFAKALCEKYSWPEFTGSPMIWKQHDWARSKASFLGDENKFQELMNEIYGVETFVPCEVGNIENEIWLFQGCEPTHLLPRVRGLCFRI